jgi:hypothetical protein
MTKNRRGQVIFGLWACEGLRLETFKSLQLKGPPLYTRASRIIGPAQNWEENKNPK